MAASVDVLRGEPALAARLGVWEPVLGRAVGASGEVGGQVGLGMSLRSH